MKKRGKARPLPAGRIVTGDCGRTMDRWPAASVDAVVTSPPYPRIRREYGRWTEFEWLRWMRAVVRSARRVVKPSGSMLFVIGPNLRAAGSLAPWPYQFVLDLFAADLNVVQDAYWVKVCRIPAWFVTKRRLLRDAVEWCVWIGAPDCYRDDAAVLWECSESMKKLLNLAKRGRLQNQVYTSPSGATANRASFAVDRGGVKPMNVIATANAGREAMGHPAAFPEALAEFWIKYLCPPGGAICDPFAGSGTTCAVAKRLGRQWVGIEKIAAYARRARLRVTRTPGPSCPQLQRHLSTAGNPRDLGRGAGDCQNGRFCLKTNPVRE